MIAKLYARNAQRGNIDVLYNEEGRNGKRTRVRMRTQGYVAEEFKKYEVGADSKRTIGSDARDGQAAKEARTGLVGWLVESWGGTLAWGGVTAMWGMSTTASTSSTTDGTYSEAWTGCADKAMDEYTSTAT